MNRQSLPTSPLFQSDPKNEKEGPELNHDYISYSVRFDIDEIVEADLLLISLDHVRIRRPIESSCS